ncbi:MAG: DUF3157 family protein [Niabella sp.]
MNRIFIILLLLFYTQVSCAQRTIKHIVKTTDGVTVKLYDDYTWEYTSRRQSSYGNKNSRNTYNAGLSSSKKSSTVAKKTTTRKANAGRAYYRGPRGGCYYYTSGGSKVYVDRSYCN